MACDEESTARIWREAKRHPADNDKDWIRGKVHEHLAADMLCHPRDEDGEAYCEINRPELTIELDSDYVADMTFPGQVKGEYGGQPWVADMMSMTPHELVYEIRLGQ